MSLLRTKYRTAVVQGLTLTAGSQIESVVRVTLISLVRLGRQERLIAQAMMAFTPFLFSITGTLSATPAPSPISGSSANPAIFTAQIIDDVATFMAKEVGSNRVFVPALQTAWRLAIAMRDAPGREHRELDHM